MGKLCEAELNVISRSSTVENKANVLMLASQLAVSQFDLHANNYTLAENIKIPEADWTAVSFQVFGPIKTWTR